MYGNYDSQSNGVKYIEFSKDKTRHKRILSKSNMSSHFYEVALFGEFFAQDLKPIMNRIMLHSESAQPMHCRELVFEPIDAHHQRENNTEPVLLRARKEVLEPNSKWFVLMRLEY
jgi:mediator of RNA polymerase II transcription subunit 18